MPDVTEGATVPKGSDAGVQAQPPAPAASGSPSPAQPGPVPPPNVLEELGKVLPKLIGDAIDPLIKAQKETDKKLKSQRAYLRREVAKFRQAGQEPASPDIDEDELDVLIDEGAPQAAGIPAAQLVTRAEAVVNQVTLTPYLGEELRSNPDAQMAAREAAYAGISSGMNDEAALAMARGAAFPFLAESAAQAAKARGETPAEVPPGTEAPANPAVTPAAALGSGAAPPEMPGKNAIPRQNIEDAKKLGIDVPQDLI